ncbi:MAG TPA: hypothetical protein PKU97_07930 [Kofleriaceae bacterium]|nr:hypothetical protein [Kofleriaceae bacterium]
MRNLLFFSTLLVACYSESPTDLIDPLPVDPGDPIADSSDVGFGDGEELDSTDSELALALPTLLVGFDRVELEGNDIIAVTSKLANGTTPVSGAVVTITTPDGIYSTVTETSPGTYVAYVLPHQPSGHVRVRVAGGGRVVNKTALTLPDLGPHWNQPEPVPGLVNTAGYEDSAEVSPDGEWLLVSDYSPVDMICCIFGTCGATPTTQLNPAAPHCNNSLGPVTGNYRPRMPGANRVISSTVIHDEAPSIGYDMPDGVDLPVALAPLAGYGFRRQADGSFAQPFLITFSANGISTPFGYTFVGSPTGTAATLAFAYDDLRNVRGDYGPSTLNDLYHNPVTLGVDNILGTFSVDAQGRPVTDRFPTSVPLPTKAGQQGNPAVSSDGLWFDSENEAEDLFFAAGNAVGTATLATPVKVALSTPARKETQPYVHGGRLYFAADQSTIRSSARAPGGNPALASTWGPERLELAAEPTTRVGGVIAIGEPSLSVRAGVTTMYFIYVLQTSTGLNLNVGRVNAR